jgi:hypothetical protein
LDLDKRSDLGFVANLAAIEIDKTKDAHIASELYIWRD